MSLCIRFSYKDWDIFSITNTELDNCYRNICSLNIFDDPEHRFKNKINKISFSAGIPTIMYIGSLFNTLSEMYLTGDIISILMRFVFRNYDRFSSVCLLLDSLLLFLQETKDCYENVNERYKQTINNIISSTKMKQLFDHNYLLLLENESFYY